MAEAAEESTYVWSHKARITLFLSAMRHFRDTLRENGTAVHYRQLDHPRNHGSLSLELKRSIDILKPQRLVLTQPGEWRVQKALTTIAEAANLPLEVCNDGHFFETLEGFSQYAGEGKALRMASFYRKMRRATGILMTGDKPEGGKWSYDTENRGTFSKTGPGKIPQPKSFSPDGTTREVMKLVEKRFSGHPGRLTHFDWPVNPGQASKALADFTQKRLPQFGTYQDAMWTKCSYLYHSRLSSAMNLKLLNPREAVTSAERAYRNGSAPLNSVEGFVRQVLGWREYVRGVYWHFMPEYEALNALNANAPLPPFYWTGDTEMNCLRETIRQTLDTGYAHHIQRLMVTGLFALLLGVDPREVHRWYLAIYVDAVEWAELPNTLGMSQFADGGIMASKPYVASGKYIGKMSNYCRRCRYDPSQALSDDACPFTTLYWDFLIRHGPALRENPRMGLQLRNLDPFSKEKCRAIAAKTSTLRKNIQ